MVSLPPVGAVINRSGSCVVDLFVGDHHTDAPINRSAITLQPPPLQLSHKHSLACTPPRRKDSRENVHLAAEARRHTEETNGDKPDMKKTKNTYSLFCSHTIFIQTCAYIPVHHEISSISCVLFFSLRVLYLTITCNDRDIKIMITVFANAALSAHAHTG